MRPARAARSEGTLERVVIATVDPLGRPALGEKARLDAAGPPVRRRRVVDHDGRQPLEAGPSRVLDRLPVAALVELTVADEDVDAPTRERDADGDRQSVTERAARD